MPAGRPRKSRSTKEVAPLSVVAKQALVVAAFSAAMKFEKTEDLDVWSDKNRFLPKETSSEYGPWRTSRFPFLRRIMKCLSPSSIAEEIVFMKGGQLGGTEVSLNWLYYSSVCNPGPMAYMQKTDDAVTGFVKQKYKPGIRDCPAVARTLGDEKPLGYSKALLDHGYPGGYQVFGAANNTDFLKSRSLAGGVMDEEDQYKLNVDSQGAPRKLLAMRMVNFPGAKLYRISTPVLKENSTIEPGFYEGSEEEFYVPCPCCNPTADDTKFMFKIEWETIHWSKELDKEGDPVRVWCECPACGHDIDELEHKTWMLANGDWFSTKNLEDPANPLPRYRVGDVLRPSFRLPSFYSPLGFLSWNKIVHDWLEYVRTRDINLLQVIVNQYWAQTFSHTGGDIDHSGLYARREPYKTNQGREYEVPAGGLCLTAGVDVQEDRIEVEVVGWGMFDESYSVDYKVLVGDTSLLGNQWGTLDDGQPSVWRLLHDYLCKRFRHESGVVMPIEMTMIDTGYRPDEVHKFCRPREHMRVFPLKGRPGWGNGLWKRATRRHEKYKTIDYAGFVDELKAKTYSFLKIDEPGPGYCHFPLNPIYSERHFRGLTAEKQLTKMVAGRIKLYWENPSGRRNEQLDCRNYAYVARSAYGVNLDQRAQYGLQSIFGVDPLPTPRRPRRRGSKGLDG